MPGRLLLPRCPPPHPTPSLPCFSCFSAKPWLAPCQPLFLLIFFVGLDVSCIDLPHIFLHFSTFDSFQQSHNKYCHVGTFAHTRPAQLSLVLPFFLSGMKYVLVEAEQIHPLDVAVCGLTHTQGSAFIFGRSVKSPSQSCLLFEFIVWDRLAV